MKTQIYEDYWKSTLGFTNIYSKNFNKILNLIVNFIDTTKHKEYSEEKYIELQKDIYKIYPKNEASIRKVINTYIKLGFVNSKLKSYHNETPLFLIEKDKTKKKTIFSKIVYSNASFDRSVKNISSKKEINFLLKTLNEVKKMSKLDLLALMTIDIARFPKGYLNQEELQKAKDHVKATEFGNRKYNQVEHLWLVLKKLDDLTVDKKYVYLEKDAVSVVSDTKDEERRDHYLQRLYKNQLKEESKELFGIIQCMLEKLDYPSLVASHIKPFRYCLNEEAYDGNNGLLLSQNMDFLFDRGYISFKDDGEIMLSKNLTDKLRNYLKKFSLDSRLMSDNRKNYLGYHRDKVFIN
ncbi:MAG: HNH endonuclease [Candidatus Levybacteria bacterium]|nr:HNH endonuclease [Candidatus Levybacteria bacterium]